MQRVQKRVLKRRTSPYCPTTSGTRKLLLGFRKLNERQQAYLLDQILKQAGPRWREIFALYLQVAVES